MAHKGPNNVFRWDFGGWATRNDLKCCDGRIIRKNAFAHCDGNIVPLVYQHNHDDLDAVLGFALLENRPEGVYAWGSFDSTEEGQRAKAKVQHGDITSLSIYANQLKQHNGDVLHGNIRELSLVLSPANPGAYIEFPALSHGEDGYSDECFLVTCTGEPFLIHSENDNDMEDIMDYEEIYDSLDDEQRALVDALVNQAADIAADEASDQYEALIDEYEDAIDGYEDAIDEYEDALSDYDEEEDYEEEPDEFDDDYDDVEDFGHGDPYGDNFYMKRNAFEDYGDNYGYDDELYHSDDDLLAFEEDVIHDLRRYGTLKDSFLAHAEDYGIGDYGIGNLDYLFPEPHSLDNNPQFIKRRTEWVTKVLNGVQSTPFGRIKSLFANITLEEARAKGYIKGKRKKEEFFTLIKRITNPTTIYKKQKLDRNDKLDLKNFDIIGFLKGEMRLMLSEESARSIMFSDGRPLESEDHVDSKCIRPIYHDDDLFTVKKTVNQVADTPIAETLIDTVLKSRKDYKGTGKPDLFITESMLTDMLLLKDGIGRRLYKSSREIADILRIAEIVTIPDEIVPDDFMALEVNMADYTVGSDAGGEVTFMEDFDIDYNQDKILAEARFCGALTKPFSAIAYKKPVTTQPTNSEEDDSGSGSGGDVPTQQEI